MTVIWIWSCLPSPTYHKRLHDRMTYVRVAAKKNTKNVVENEMCQYRGIIIRQISSKVEVKSFTYRTIYIQDGNDK